jgi:hypothetical protein
VLHIKFPSLTLASSNTNTKIMETKITQGEWYIEGLVEYPISPFQNGHISIKAGEVGVPVAQIAMAMGNNPIHIEKQQANAKLIASAPELLEALKYFNDGFDHFLKCANLKDSFLDSEAIVWLNEVSINSRKAIEKATAQS